MEHIKNYDEKTILDMIKVYDKHLKNKEYKKNYYKNRYENDLVYRSKKLESNKRYMRKIKLDENKNIKIFN